MRIRRLKILGVAMALAGLAALLGIVLYLLPREAAPSINRTADFVLVNEATSFAREHGPTESLLRLPDWDDENEQLRLIAIDESSMSDPRDPAHPGLGQFPWPRSLYGKLLQRLHRAGAVQALQQLAVQRTRPGKLAEPGVRRIARIAHRAFVDRDQAQLLVLVVPVRQPQQRFGGAVFARERRRLVHEHEVRRPVDRRGRLAREQVQDDAQQRREARERHRDAENLEAADTHRATSAGSLTLDAPDVAAIAG